MKSPPIHRRFFLGVYVAIGLAGFLTGRAFLPRQIELAYQGQGFGPLNDLFASQRERPLEFYLHFLDRTSSAVLILWMGIAVVIWLVTNEAFQRRWEGWHGAASRVYLMDALGKIRAIIVTGAICFLVGMSFVSILSSIDLWPFSPYSMYSHSRRRLVSPELNIYRVYAVTAEERHREFRMRRDDIRPILPPQGFYARLGLINLRDRPEQECAAALTEFLARYESRRETGRHDGPKLVALRLYKLHWNQLDPLARDVAEPDRRIRICEVRMDDFN